VTATPERISAGNGRAFELPASDAALLSPRGELPPELWTQTLCSAPLFDDAAPTPAFEAVTVEALLKHARCFGTEEVFAVGVSSLFASDLVVLGRELRGTYCVPGRHGEKKPQRWRPSKRDRGTLEVAKRKGADPFPLIEWHADSGWWSTADITLPHPHGNRKVSVASGESDLDPGYAQTRRCAACDAPIRGRRKTKTYCSSTRRSRARRGSA